MIDRTKASDVGIILIIYLQRWIPLRLDRRGKGQEGPGRFRPADRARKKFGKPTFSGNTFPIAPGFNNYNKSEIRNKQLHWIVIYNSLKWGTVSLLLMGIILLLYSFSPEKL